ARSLMQQISKWLDRHCGDRTGTILTGHSLGAAMATLTASVLRPTLLVTLGSPRVGNADFAASLAGIACVRIVDCCDVLTRVPPEVPSYTHICPPTYITNDGEVKQNPDPDFIAVDRDRGRREYLTKEAWKIGAVVVRDLADHAPINYARAFFK